LKEHLKYGRDDFFVYRDKLFIFKTFDVFEIWCTEVVFPIFPDAAYSSAKLDDVHTCAYTRQKIDINVNQGENLIFFRNSCKASDLFPEHPEQPTVELQSNIKLLRKIIFANNINIIYNF